MRSLKKILSVLLMVVVLFSLAPSYSFAATNKSGIKFTISSVVFVMQGRESYVDVEVNAPDDVSYKLTAETDAKNVNIATATSGTYTGKVNHTFTISADRKAETGWYTLTIKAIDPDNKDNVLLKRDVSLSITDTHNGQAFISSPAMEVSYTIQDKETLVAGEQNVLKLA